MSNLVWNKKSPSRWRRHSEPDKMWRREGEINHTLSG